jgi:hypothetical protein
VDSKTNALNAASCENGLKENIKIDFRPMGPKIDGFSTQKIDSRPNALYIDFRPMVLKMAHFRPKRWIFDHDGCQRSQSE